MTPSKDKVTIAKGTNKGIQKKYNSFSSAVVNEAAFASTHYKYTMRQTAGIAKVKAPPHPPLLPAEAGRKKKTSEEYHAG